MAILDFQRPDKVYMIESTDSVGNFEFRPLEPGYGLTIGNALRRVLISSLEGFAITSIKIEGVDHEFSTIKGVVEDVAEMILNLKQVRLKQQIEDEHSEAEVYKINVYENFIDVPARTTIQEVEEIIGFNLLDEDMDEEIDTIGGLVFLLAGRIPQRGELITHPRGFEIEIKEVDQRKIINVRFRLKVK